MAFSALIFPMLVMTLTAGVFMNAWRSESAMRAFRRSFLLTFILVLLTPWVGAYSAETAIVNGTVAGLLDNGNDTSRFFFLSLAESLEKDHGVSKVILKTKPASSKAATNEMLDELAGETDFVVAGVAL